jgi:hypothetical protein
MAIAHPAATAPRQQFSLGPAAVMPVRSGQRWCFQRAGITHRDSDTWADSSNGSRPGAKARLHSDPERPRNGHTRARTLER